MRLKVAVLMAFKTLKEDKRKAFLTMSGIIIGIAAVIAVVSLGEGYKNKMLKDLQGGKTDTELELYIDFTPEKDEDYDKIQNIFNNTDKELVENIENVKKAEFMYEDENGLSKIGKIDTKQKRCTIYKATDEIKMINVKSIIAGRDLNDNDNEKNVTILSASSIKKMYKNPEDVLNKTVFINNTGFKVVGIYEKVTEMDEDLTGGEPPVEMMLPLETYSKYFNTKNLNPCMIKLTVGQGADVKLLKSQIEKELKLKGSNRSKGIYTCMDLGGVTEMVGSLIGTITTFIAFVAGISLFIAAIGIMNMIYTSVSERIQEIGIKRALGARKKDIRIEFILEGIAISFTGGVIGYILGLGLSGILSLALNMSISPSITTVTLAVGISVGIGILSSVLPAGKAANANPVEILR